MKILSFMCIIYQAVAFVPGGNLEMQHAPSSPAAFLARMNQDNYSYGESSSVVEAPKKSTLKFKLNSAIAGFSLGSFSMIPAVVAEAVDIDEAEIAELPPPWVPAIFAVLLLGGVGVLTGSLGDVMSEEASLGMQSGARAKKEMERSRSSYFKKK